MVTVLGLLSQVFAGPAVSQTPSPTAQSVLAGSRVFGTRGCSACHAIRGVGATLGPDLAEVADVRSLSGFGAALWAHLPTMAGRLRDLDIPRPRLTPWETRDLVAFLFWLDYFEPQGNADVGRQLFAGKGCVACHQVGGVGGVVGPNLDLLNQYDSPLRVAAAMWNHTPAMETVFRERGIARPAFTGAELRDLVAYLRSQAPDLPAGLSYVLPGDPGRGREAFVIRQCSSCHGAAARGRAGGPDLTRMRRASQIDFAAAMWNKSRGMTAAMRQRGIDVPQLEPGEMADIFAFLYSAQAATEEGNASRGRRVVRAKGCLQCHTLEGQGATGGTNLGAAAQVRTDAAAVVAALWNHVTALADSEQPVAEWPVLTARDVADLTAFLGLSGGTR